MKNLGVLYFDKYNMITRQPPRPICLNCKFSLAKPNGKSKHGFQKWHRYCVECAKSIYNPRFKHLQHKKLKCDQCGFEALDKCQMDLIFKDENKKNKTKKNLLTLCANCSRLHRKNQRTGKKSIMNVTVDADIIIS